MVKEGHAASSDCISAIMRSGGGLVDYHYRAARFYSDSQENAANEVRRYIGFSLISEVWKWTRDRKG